MGQPYDEIVRSARMFQGLQDATLDRLRAAYVERSAAPGSFFFREQEPAGHLFLLARGRVKISQVSEDGQQVTMRIIVPGQPFGGVAVLGTGAAYPVSAEAMEECVALAWSGDLLRQLAGRDSGLGLAMTGLMYGHVNEMQSRFMELATERVERRVARTLLRLATQAGRRQAEGVLIDLPLSRQAIAEMTGTTLFTVSRLLSEWERKRLIETGRERVVILDTPGLSRIAEDSSK